MLGCALGLGDTPVRWRARYSALHELANAPSSTRFRAPHMSFALGPSSACSMSKSAARRLAARESVWTLKFTCSTAGPRAARKTSDRSSSCDSRPGSTATVRSITPIPSRATNVCIHLACSSGRRNTLWAAKKSRTSNLGPDESRSSVRRATLNPTRDATPRRRARTRASDTTLASKSTPFTWHPGNLEAIAHVA
jgi:hypothetical protein